MKTKLLSIVFFVSFNLMAQVGVNTTTPNPSSMLDVSATNKGVLFPRVSLSNINVTQLDGVNTAATGLLIWNTNAATVGGNGVGYYYFNGTIWVPVMQTASSDHDWYEVGTTVAPNAITDNMFHTGNVAIGKNTISADLPKLDIENSTSSLTALRITDLSTGIGLHQGINLNMHSTAAASEWGILVSHNNANAPLKYGISSWVQNGSGTNSAFQGRITGTGLNIGSGIQIFDSGSASSSEQTGYLTIFEQPTSEESFGLHNIFNTNNVTNDTGNKYGVYNLFDENVGGTIYGLYNNFDLVNSSSYNKYGSYTFIPPLSGGTHYGLYSNVTKASSYAGYFLGNVSIGTTTTNNYILPPSRGTNGQIMQTNGTGNVTWVNPSIVDNQQIDVLTLTGDTLNISLQDDGVATQTLNLAAIDNQATDVFSLTGTTLNLSLQNDGVPTQTVNLASLVGTDDQNLVTPTLVGTTLNLNIENGTGTSINLAPLDTDDQNIDVLTLTGDTLNISLANDGVPTQTLNLAAIDNQATDVFSLTGTTLNLSLQNDGVPTQTVNLASLVGTDDQNLTAPTLVGTTLNLGIESGIGTSINLASLDTDNQQIDTFSLTGTTLNLSLQDDGVATQTVDLSSIRDHDWYEQGTTSAPNNINDNIFTNGSVGIGTNTTTSHALEIERIGNFSLINTIRLGNNTSGNDVVRVEKNQSGGNGLVVETIGSVLNGGTPIVANQLNGYTLESKSALKTTNVVGNMDVRLADYSSTDGIRGVFSSINSLTSSNHAGLFEINHAGVNQIATSFGVSSHINSTGTIGPDYAFDAVFTGLSGATKYAYHTNIPSTLGGTHYGIYSNVRKAGSYAGYFLGQVSIGTTPTNIYLLPPSRGTNGQIMQTDGTGLVNWVNQSLVDNQTIDVLSLTGDNLNISLQDDGVATQTLNLSSIDNQATDVFSLTGTTLNLSLQNDGVATQTVDLSSLNTDDQNIQNLAFNTTTNILTVGIENGTSQTVDLSILDTGGDVTAVTAGAGLTGGGVTGALTLTAAANNGLNVDATADAIQLGGPLTENTTITNGTFNMIFDVNSTGTFKVQDAGVDKFEMNTFGDGVFGGATYWRNGSTATTDAILGRFIPSAGSGLFDVYGNGSINHTINGNGTTTFNNQGLDIDFAIESDTRTNMFFVDAGDSIVRIANSVGATPQNGTSKTVNAVTFNVDYIANFSDGGSGSTIGIGSAEFMTDGGNQIIMMDANLTPFNDNDDALGSSDYRWTAVWAVDGTINTSDVSLKKNIKPLNYGLKDLMDIETITYQWKNSDFDDTKIGFSAQNLKSVIPEVVRDYDVVVTDETTNSKIKVPSAKLGVYYSDLIPVTVKAIQELKEKNDELEDKVKELEQKLSKLEIIEAQLKELMNK